MRAFAAAAALVFVFPAIAGASSESSMRCPGGIVAVGDPTIDLLGKCGMPALREVRASDTYVAVATVGQTFGRTAVLTSERWTYDFGPQQFLMLVVVDGGRIQSMHRGGYGYNRTEVSVTLPRAACEWTSLHVGDAKLDLIARCGEPALVELRTEGVVVGGPGTLRDAAALSRAALHEVEVWTYDFGPQSFVRFVVIDGGVVVRIDTGSRGYSR
jgi:hypothetical protein